MRYALSTTLLVIAGCGSGAHPLDTGKSPGTDARARCGQLGLPADYVEATLHSVDGTVLAMESAMAGTSSEGNPGVIVNSVYGSLNGVCVDRFVDPACGEAPCFDPMAVGATGSADVDFEACCQFCDLDANLETGLACLECTGAILQEELGPTYRDVLTDMLEELDAEIEELPRDMCTD